MYAYYSIPMCSPKLLRKYPSRVPSKNFLASHANNRVPVPQFLKELPLHADLVCSP